jgi:hypothetical protein
MIKKIFIFLVLTLFKYTAIAQTDNSAYESQRRKVNHLLEERSQKFGRYDESLNMRTGIFGLKTKKDMQRSIDILSEIVKTDNGIFRETKILLEHKDLEKSQVQTRVVENETRLGAYMQTIRKLQQENDRLQKELALTETKRTKFINTLIGFIILIAIAAIFLIKSKK